MTMTDLFIREGLAGFSGRDPVMLARRQPEEYARLQKVSPMPLPTSPQLLAAPELIHAFHFKIAYSSVAFFPVQMFFSKASLLALFYRIFGVDRTFSRWIYGILAVHSIWAIIVLFLNLFPCKPVRKAWYPRTPGHCLSQAVVAVPEETVNSLIDFAMVILAVYMIRPLHMPKRTKWKLRLLFGLGSL
jgi:hypothetical protein